jgi:amidase
VRTPDWGSAAANQRELFDAHCDALRRAGARVEQVELPVAFNDANRAARVIQLAEMARAFDDLYRRDRERMSATFRDLCEQGARITRREYADALESRQALSRALDELLAAFDAMVTLAAAGEAPRGLQSTGDATFCSPWTLCGVPSVAFPTALGVQGMPMGLQVVGRHLDDVRTLEVAQWCADRLPFGARLAMR